MCNGYLIMIHVCMQVYSVSDVYRVFHEDVYSAIKIFIENKFEFILCKMYYIYKTTCFMKNIIFLILRDSLRFFTFLEQNQY